MIGNPPCAWCPWTVVSDGQNCWVHLYGRYACRDRQGIALLGRYAFPRTPRWPLVTSADLPKCGRRVGVVVCANCTDWVVPDGRDGWIHLDRSYACRNSVSVL